MLYGHCLQQYVLDLQIQFRHSSLSKSLRPLRAIPPILYSDRLIELENSYIFSQFRHSIKGVMMSEGKVVSRSVAVGLGILCIIFIASLAGTIVYCTMMINNKNGSYDDYVASHSHTNSEYDSLNAKYQTYTRTHSHNNSNMTR
jgi:hypothetical protein